MAASKLRSDYVIPVLGNIPYGRGSQTQGASESARGPVKMQITVSQPMNFWFSGLELENLRFQEALGWCRWRRSRGHTRRTVFLWHKVQTPYGLPGSFPRAPVIHVRGSLAGLVSHTHSPSPGTLHSWARQALCDSVFFFLLYTVWRLPKTIWLLRYSLMNKFFSRKYFFYLSSPKR